MDDHEQRATITIVSGLPRSGTSMVMQMLVAGGLPVLADNDRAPDEDNLRGYFEYAPVKGLKADTSWLPLARGRAVKVISALLPYLPQGEHYRLIIISREINEVLASQRQMLLRRGGASSALDDGEMARHFAEHLRRVDACLARRPDLVTLRLEHRTVLADPAGAAQAIERFLGAGLAVPLMAAAVSPALYRQRVDAM